MNLGASCTLFAFESMAIDFICTGISVAIAAVIVWFAVRYKNLWAAVLAGVQVVGTLILEFMFSHGIEVPYGLYFDSLSLLMTFIIRHLHLRLGLHGGFPGPRAGRGA